jgi:hypothetical protein
MKRSAIPVLLVFLASASSLLGAPRLTSVEPALASPGDSLAASGTDLNEVERLFLTVGNTDVQVQITGKTADEIKFTLPAKIAHGQYKLMLRTGGSAPALLVQPVMCEVMSAAEVAERRAESRKEEQLIDAAASPPEDAPPAK